MGSMPTPHEYRAKDGTTTWRVRFRAGTRHSSETFATLAEAQTFADDVRNRGAAWAVKALADTDDERTLPTLDEIATAFWTWKSTEVRSDRTIADYRRDYRKWISPHFGRTAAARITPIDIQRWVDDTLKPNLSAKSVRDRHALLHAIFAYAASPARKIIPANPCIESGVKLPPKAAHTPKGMTPGEWRALYPALQAMDPDAADLADFMVATGWRFSEAAAVTVHDIDVYRGRVHVTMNHVLRRNAAGQHVIVEDGKSRAAQRRVRLDDDAGRLVLRRAQDAPPSGLIFTTRTRTQWHYSNLVNRAWRPAVAAANLARKPTPHWCRHTAVYWLSLAGARPVEIQKRIGHASLDTTYDVYGTMLTDVDDTALVAYAALRNGSADDVQMISPGLVVLDQPRVT